MSVKITTVTGADLHPGPYMARWIFGDHPNEKIDTKKSSTLADKKHARLHVLSVNGHDYGFVAVDIHQFKKDLQFYIQVVYLFVSRPHRGKKIPELDGMSVSTYLMGHVISESLETAKFLPVKALVLLPAAPRLETLYEDFGFTSVQGLPRNSPKFMSLPLDWRE